MNGLATLCVAVAACAIAAAAFAVEDAPRSGTAHASVPKRTAPSPDPITTLQIPVPEAGASTGHARPVDSGSDAVLCEPARWSGRMMRPGENEKTGRSQ